MAVRSERSCVSLLELTPISESDVVFEAMDDTKESGISWSQSGRYCARIHGTTVFVSDSQDSFREIASFQVEGTLRDVAFCPAKGQESLLAMVGLDGQLTVLRMRPASAGSSFEVVRAKFVEEQLWVVTWSPGENIIYFALR